MEDSLESFYSIVEEFVWVNTSGNWAYILVGVITIIVLFYGTRYVLTGVDGGNVPNDNLPYKRCNVGSRAAVVSMKGHRQYMEDTYQAVPSFGGRDNWSFYGVFDGHGGARCSVYVAHFLYKHVWSCIDLYLEHYSLNSNNLWKLLLNDENLITISNNDDNDNDNDSNSKHNNNNNTNNLSNGELNEPLTNGESEIENENNIKQKLENKNKNKEKDKKDEEEEEQEQASNRHNLIVTANNNDNDKEEDKNKNNSNLTNENVEEMEKMSKLKNTEEKKTVDTIDSSDYLGNSNSKSKNDKSMSVMSQRGSEVPDLDNEPHENNSNMNGNIKITKSTKQTTRRKLIGIPRYVNEIMKEALIQSHRYADKEFLAMANRQQWQDGSTAISCVILPAKDILHALMNGERNGSIKNHKNKNKNSNNNKNKNRSNGNTNNRNNYSKHNENDKESMYSVPNVPYISNNSSNISNNNNDNSNYTRMNRNTENSLNIDDICDDKDTWLFVANTGDSRAILVSKTGESFALSSDHKPNRLDERRRIEDKGGRVVFFGVWRVEGVLAVSRAFGDRRLKRWVVPDPEILSRKIDFENDLFVILASDGVWDCVSNEQAGKYAYEVWNDSVYNNTDLKTKLQAIAGKISGMAFRHGSMDNITALVVHIPTHCTYGISTSRADHEANEASESAAANKAAKAANEEGNKATNGEAFNKTATGNGNRMNENMNSFNNKMNGT